MADKKGASLDSDLEQLKKLRPIIKMDSLRRSLTENDLDFKIIYDDVVSEFYHLSNKDREKGLDAFQKLIESKSRITLSDLDKILILLERMCPQLKQLREKKAKRNKPRPSTQTRLKI